MIIVLAKPKREPGHEEFHAYVCIVEKEEDALTLGVDLLVGQNGFDTTDTLRALSLYDMGLPLTDQQWDLIKDNDYVSQRGKHLWTTHRIGTADPAYTEPTVLCSDFLEA